MENIYEIIGSTVTFNNSEQYYILDCKKTGDCYYCYGMRVNSETFDEGGNIFEMSLKDGELQGDFYTGENYQSLYDKFTDPDNLRQCLQFMDIQRDALKHNNGQK